MESTRNKNKQHKMALGGICFIVNDGMFETILARVYPHVNQACVHAQNEWKSFNFSTNKILYNPFEPSSKVDKTSHSKYFVYTHFAGSKKSSLYIMCFALCTLVLII